ncbi:MAG: galactokinase, partial [Pseudomonadales bacterium]|nr:galactokinase [Pseudomonadales bacterium]
HQTFGREGEFELFSPGRVNLIGEHIDYCGGQVMPMAIDMGTSCVGAASSDHRLRLYSTRFEEMVELDVDALPDTALGHWSDYAVGVARMLHADDLRGLDLWIDDNIGAGGLSSSASFSVAVALALLHVAGRYPAVEDSEARLDLAGQCRRAENEFVGVSCGIMDQASVALGGTVLLDCGTLAFERVDADFNDYRLVIMDTGKERTLAVSAYNERVRETRRIAETLGIANLCELPEDRLARALDTLDDEVLKRRLRHLVTEQQRVMAAKTVLNRGDLVAFGELMSESHRSLAEDYEVTGPELDTMVHLALDQPGVPGARMTGAGFGGCAIALIARDRVEETTGRVAEGYRKRTGLMPRFFPVVASPAAQLR